MIDPMMTLADAQALLPGSRLVGDGATCIARVHSDTRSLQPGDLFVALKGERFDAHDFLASASAASSTPAWTACSSPTPAPRSARSAPPGARASRCRWWRSPAATARPR